MGTFVQSTRRTLETISRQRQLGLRRQTQTQTQTHEEKHLGIQQTNKHRKIDRQKDTKPKHPTNTMAMESTKIIEMVSARSLGSIASIEDKFTGRQKLTYYVVFACITGGLAGLLFGFDQNIFNMVFTQDDFRSQFGMPPAVSGCGADAPQEPAWVSNRLSMVTSFYPLGCAATSPFAGAISDRFGRYKSLWMGMVVFFVGATMQTAANGYEMLMVGRLIAGASIGVLSSVVPVYIAELAPHHLRGGLGTMFQLGITFGALFSSIWCYIMQAAVHVDYTWRLEAGFQLIIGLAMALCMCFIPESPRWLVKSGQKDKARTVLAQLRSEGEEEVTDAEFRE